VTFFAKGGSEKAMEVKLGKTGLARRLLEQNARLVFGGEEVASATEPAEGVVMEKLRHEGMILPFRLSLVASMANKDNNIVEGTRHSALGASFNAQEKCHDFSHPLSPCGSSSDCACTSLLRRPGRGAQGGYQ